MQRREFVRQPSRSARWALTPAVLSLVLAVIGTFAHRLDFVSSANFVMVMVVAFGFAAIGVLLAFSGFRALWKRAAFGGVRSAAAMAFAMPVFTLGLAVIFLTQTTPRLSDVSSDTANPPHFRFNADSSLYENRLEPPRINAAAQSAYKGLTGRRYSLSADMVAGHVQTLVQSNGWTTSATLPQRNGENEWLIEASVRTSLFGFRDSVVVRIIDEGEAAYVDMRSASGFGESDLGANARRIRKFMADLDLQISLGATQDR